MQVRLGARVLIPGLDVQGIAATGGIGLEERDVVQLRNEGPGAGQLDRVEAHGERGTAAEGAPRPQHRLHGADGRSGEDQHQPRTVLEVIPHGLDDAQKPWRDRARYGTSSMMTSSGSARNRKAVSQLPNPPPARSATAVPSPRATVAWRRTRSTASACWVAAKRRCVCPARGGHTLQGPSTTKSL